MLTSSAQKLTVVKEARYNFIYECIAKGMNYVSILEAVEQKFALKRRAAAYVQQASRAV
jgi:hypothetical protein